MGPSTPYGSGRLGAALRAARERAGLSQFAVATHVRLHGAMISCVELGQRRLCDARVIEIERYLECEPGSLVSAAQEDRGGLFFPSTGDQRDRTLVDLFMAWRDLDVHKVAAIRRILTG